MNSVGRASGIWDTQRLQTIGEVMQQYAGHITVGDRLRLGMEGDPVYAYRSAADAPRGDVISVQRDDDGLVSIQVKLNDGSVEAVDNLSVDPRRVWEIDPAYLPTFTAKAIARSVGATVREDDAGHDESRAAQQLHQASAAMEEKLQHELSDLKQYRGQMQDRLGLLSEQLRDVDDTNRDFRTTTAATIRHIVADLLSVGSGGELIFAKEYADKYDIAMQNQPEISYGRTDAPKEHATTTTSTPSHAKNKSHQKDTYQGEKYPSPSSEPHHVDGGASSVHESKSRAGRVSVEPLLYGKYGIDFVECDRLTS